MEREGRASGKAKREGRTSGKGKIEGRKRGETGRQRETLSKSAEKASERHQSVLVWRNQRQIRKQGINIQSGCG